MCLDVFRVRGSNFSPSRMQDDATGFHRDLGWYQKRQMQDRPPEHSKKSPTRICSTIVLASTHLQQIQLVPLPQDPRARENVFSHKSQALS